MLKIDHGVPIPKITKTCTKSEYVIAAESMKVGDSVLFAVDDKRGAKLLTQALYRLDKKASQRSTPEGIRVWRMWGKAGKRAKSEPVYEPAKRVRLL